MNHLKSDISDIIVCAIICVAVALFVGGLQYLLEIGFFGTLRYYLTP